MKFFLFVAFLAVILIVAGSFFLLLINLIAKRCLK